MKKGNLTFLSLLRMRSVRAILLLFLFDVLAIVLFNALSGIDRLLTGLWMPLVVEGLAMMVISLVFSTSFSRKMKVESLYSWRLERHSEEHNRENVQPNAKLQDDEMIGLLFGLIGLLFVMLGTILAS
jgi:hypothetical protein